MKRCACLVVTSIAALFDFGLPGNAMHKCYDTALDREISLPQEPRNRISAIGDKIGPVTPGKEDSQRLQSSVFDSFCQSYKGVTRRMHDAD